MEKKLIIGNKEYLAKELTYLQGLELIDLSKKEQAKKMILYSTGITEEELEKLSFKEGILLQGAVNEVNDLTNFQNPMKDTETDLNQN